MQKEFANFVNYKRHNYVNNNWFYKSSLIFCPLVEFEMMLNVPNNESYMFIVGLMNMHT